MHDDRGADHDGRNDDGKTEAVARAIHLPYEDVEIAMHELNLQAVRPDASRDRLKVAGQCSKRTEYLTAGIRRTKGQR